MRIFVAFCLIMALGSQAVHAQKLYDNVEKLWTPQKDEVFLQEVSEIVFTDAPVTSAVVYNDEVFAVMEGSVFLLKGGQLVSDESAPEVNCLLTEGEMLWALTEKGIYLREEWGWKKADSRKYVDLCMHAGAVHAATSEEIFRYENGEFVSLKPEGGYYNSDITMVMDDGTQLHASPVRLGPISRIESYCETLYILRPGKLVLFDGKIVNTDFIDWGELPSKNTREMLSFGSRLFVSTDDGLATLRGAAMTVLTGEDGLPYGNTTSLTNGFDSDMWIGTTRGAIRMLKDDWHYFGADHWLPGDHVYDVAVGDKVVYVATDKGIGIIRYEPYTLLKKAEHYQRHIKEWGHNRMGFIHTLYKKDGEWLREISDNDGGHTSPYLAAMSFKYAVTGDEEARKEAVNSFYAMLWLERITPIDGYPARAIWSVEGDVGELAKHGSGGLPAKWHKSKDGKWIWKGDTSSDEAIAHFYSVSIFHDLVAEGREKELAREHISRIASHILENGWVFRGMDGKPTRWGRWNPEYLLRPYGYNDRGVNGLEALAFMRAAYAVTGDQKFEDGFQQLVDWGYAENTIRQKNIFPPSILAPWDDNLAFRSYYTLLRYTDDPKSRSIFLRSLARSWEVKRIEEVPWYNFAYGAMTGYDCEQEQSIKHLREWQLDCIEHNYTNSFRDDLITKKGYVSYEKGTRAMSPRETVVNRNSRYTMVYDGGQSGNRVMEPNAFLRDYWMGRYHGFIEAPEVTDPNLISVQPRTGQKLGAAPYAGPDKPKIK